MISPAQVELLKQSTLNQLESKQNNKESCEKIVEWLKHLKATWNYQKETDDFLCDLINSVIFARLVILRIMTK
jgi:hypothetical protein